MTWVTSGGLARVALVSYCLPVISAAPPYGPGDWVTRVGDPGACRRVVEVWLSDPGGYNEEGWTYWVVSYLDEDGEVCEDPANEMRQATSEEVALAQVTSQAGGL